MTLEYEKWSPQDEVELVLKTIKNIQSPQGLERFVGAEQASNVFKKLQELEDITDLNDIVGPVEAREIVTWAHEKAYRGWLRRVTKTMVRLKRRTTYLPEPILLRHPVMTKGKNAVCRENIWRYDSDLQHGSLMRHIVAHYTDETIPCALPIRNLGLEEGTKKRAPISEQALQDLEAEGFAISANKLAWYMPSLAFRILTTTFPNAIDAAAYNRRLNAACLPGGVLFNVEMGVTHIHVITPDGWIPSGKDGNGYIHPEHEIFKQMGIDPTPIQITNNDEGGWFVKGMLFVNSDCLHNGKPSIMVDKSMIKGKMKPMTEKLGNLEVIRFTTHLGVLSTNATPQTVGMNFEQSEVWKLTPQTKQIVAKFLDANVKRVVMKGVGHFIDDLENSSPNAGKLIKLMKAFNLDPMKCEYVRNRIVEQLNNWHRYMTTGAGIKCPYPRVDIDNRIPEGCIVINDPRFQMMAKKDGKWTVLPVTDKHIADRHDPLSTHWRISPGDEVVAFRYPTVLAQGYSKLKVVPPLREMRRDWEHNKHTVTMHSETLRIWFQGDADGDQIGVDARYGLIQLADHKIDDNIYHIEFGKTKRFIDINSPEGLLHLRQPSRELVGPLTNIRSRLLNVNDTMGAVGTSFAIQQDVDGAKSDVIPVDYMLASNLDNHTQIGPNEYKFEKVLPDEHLKDGKFDGFAIFNWMKMRMAHALRTKGIQVNAENLDDIIKEIFRWRKGYKVGDLRPLKYVFNTPQWIYNRFCIHYERNLAKLYRMQDHKSYDMSKLIWVLLRKKGYEAPPMSTTSWNEYLKGLRSISGVGNYQRKIARSIEMETTMSDREERKDIKQFVIKRTNLHQEQLVEKIKELLRTGRMSLWDLVDIWANECGHPEGSISAAITACLWEGSPILKALGIADNSDCPINDLNLLAEITSWCASEPDPFMAMTKVLAGTTDFETHTSECEYCTKILTNTLVQQIRINQTAPEFNELQKIISSLSRRRAQTTPRPAQPGDIVLAGGMTLDEFDEMF